MCKCWDVVGQCDIAVLEQSMIDDVFRCFLMRCWTTVTFVFITDLMSLNHLYSLKIGQSVGLSALPNKMSIMGIAKGIQSYDLYRKHLDEPVEDMRIRVKGQLAQRHERDTYTSISCHTLNSGVVRAVSGLTG